MSGWMGVYESVLMTLFVEWIDVILGEAQGSFVEFTQNFK